MLRSGGQVSIFENAVGSLLTPVQNAFHTVASKVKGIATNWRSYGALQADYDAIAFENEQLRMELMSAEEALQENERLKSLIDAQDTYDSLDPVYAKVIARDAGPWFKTFSVNRGTNAGVSAGMAVVNGDGLIGRVYDAVSYTHLVWALVWIRVTGPNAFCGVVTQSICSIGMVSKMYVNAIEDVDVRILESLDAAGCTTFQKIRYGVLPQIVPNFISTLIYRFDINVKDATTLGIVGAGGIGAALIQCCLLYTAPRPAAWPHCRCRWSPFRAHSRSFRP